MEKETYLPDSKMPSKKIKVKHVVIGALCFLLLVMLIFRLIIRPRLYAARNAVEQRTALVTRGDIVSTVTASGSIISSNRSEISPSVTGKVTKVYFEEGESVKAGDLLLEIDDSDARLNLKKIKNSIEQAKLTAEKNKRELDSLSITAPFDGYVTNIIPEVGDSLMKGADVLTITDYSRLKLKVAFSDDVIKNIHVGQNVRVNVEDLGQSVEGTVSYVSNSPASTSLGKVSCNVEVVLDNPGFLNDGMNARVEVQLDGKPKAGSEPGKLEYVKSKVVKSKSSGTVESVKVSEDQFVRAGQLLVELKNDDLEMSLQAADLNLEELHYQLESAEKQLEDYKIYSPIDGIVVSRNVEEGDNVKPTDVLFTILDPLHMEFSVPIDELDIAKIKEGQKVNITVDALKETFDSPISGTVSKIAIEGNSSNGVTTYPVTIRINESSNLKVGMNANAEIIVGEKNNILILPLEAVQKIGDKYYVYVKGKAGKDADKEHGIGDDKKADKSAGGITKGYASQAPGHNDRYYENAVLTPVKLGINNDDYIEVLSGLQEGDEVVLPPLAGSDESDLTMRNGMMRGFGGRRRNADEDDTGQARGNNSGIHN